MCICITAQLDNSRMLSIDWTFTILFNSCRKIVVPSESFDSKAKFLAKTRAAFGGGTFNLNDQYACRLANYYMFLKTQYYQESIPKQYFSTEYIGLQPTGDWCLARDVSKSPLHIGFVVSMITVVLVWHIFFSILLYNIDANRSRRQVFYRKMSISICAPIRSSKSSRWKLTQS